MDFLEKIDVASMRCNDHLTLLKFKIGIFGNHTHMSLSDPVLFFWNDRAYFSSRNDLLKLLNHNILAFGYDKLIPEQVLFSSYFSIWFPCIKDFFSAVNQSETVQKFIINQNNGELLTSEKIDLLTDFLCTSDLYKQAFMAERYLLHKYFFDIQTNTNFNFHFKYREKIITTEKDIKIFFDNLYNIHTDIDFSQNAEELSYFLQSNFQISPVVTKVKVNENPLRYNYHTPKSELFVSK